MIDSINENYIFSVSEGRLSAVHSGLLRDEIMLSKTEEKKNLYHRILIAGSDRPIT